MIQAWVGLWVLGPSPSLTDLVLESGAEAGVLLGRGWGKVSFGLMESKLSRPQSSSYSKLPCIELRKIRLRRERESQRSPAACGVPLLGPQAAYFLPGYLLERPSLY